MTEVTLGECHSNYHTRLVGRLKGKPPKLSPKQEAHLVALYEAGEHTGSELADLFGVARSTVYRALDRADRAVVI